MGADRVLSGADPPLFNELVYESERVRVTRLIRAGGTVIRKQLLGRDVEIRRQHELATLVRLRGAEGVAQLVDEPRYPDSIVFEDVGGRSLTGLAKPVAVDELTALALALARAVAGMHGRDVIHRDISPANVVVSADGAPCLVDFELASSLSELRSGFALQPATVGTFAYMAPEQPGWTARPVDQRADLYALGATLYELATGQPPFGSGDPLALVHDHLARVPVPPAEVNPAVPGALSRIILHLLEKDPDHRYQSADGLVHDLERLRDADAQAADALRIGEHDLPPLLLPSSRLVGREAEVAALQAAFEDARAGRCRAVLVGGAPGVGKTALVDQLRPGVTGSDGWFVAGKFDQYRRDLEFDGVAQACRALGRLLLAEPEDELAAVRERLLVALGPNAGLTTAVIPEFATLLAVPPDPGDPLTAQIRTQRNAVEVLRAIASRERPVVVFVDDMQWAGRTPIGLFDLVLSEEPVEGLLLVGAYREGDVNEAHPLAALLAHTPDQAGVRHLRLDNLPVPASVAMVVEVLHVDRTAAADLVEVIEPHTQGNPYATLELLNALRRDGVLTAVVGGWRWEPAALRAHLGRSEPARLLMARVEALPPRPRAVVDAMACLGGRIDVGVLQTAIGESPNLDDGMLTAALEEGLLVVEPGAHQAVRFRHDRLRDALVHDLGPQRRRGMQLAMARRLARVPELFAVAAELYLPVVDAVDDATERRQTVRLLRRAADQARLIGDHALVNALLGGALRLIDPGETATLAEVRTGRHSALYGLGRLEEADAEYSMINQLGRTVLEGAGATAVQVRSLTHRSRYAEAIALGRESLRELGLDIPAPDRLSSELDRQFGHLYRWLDATDAADDLARPELTDPALLATTRVIDALQPACYIADHTTFAWLNNEALRIWLQQGPGRTLIGPASGAALAAVMVRGDYAVGHRALQRIVALGEARGYEPGTSQARFLLSMVACWFGPIENAVDAGQRARAGLIAGGDLTNAGYTYYPTVYYLLDCAPSLDVDVAEVEAGLAFVLRIGSEHLRQVIDSYRWLTGVLRGESPAGAGIPTDRYAGDHLPLFHAHLTCAIATAIFGDQDGLARHTAAAKPLVPAVQGVYPAAVARLLLGLALAGEARTGPSAQRAELLSELDDVIRWLAGRAEDAPENFLHLQRLLEAERAWAVGDFRAAVLAFDTAQHEVAGRRRPWHKALIAERAARFHLGHGLDHAGHALLAEARQHYAAWGATAKVAQLDRTHPDLRPGVARSAGLGRDQPADGPAHGSTVTTGTLDLLGILSASRALSSETDLEKLHARVIQVLGALTGATDVHLLLWSDDQRDWMLPAAAGAATPVTRTGREHTTPMSVLRYVQRTGEPLVVADATDDDRFARDPHFTDLSCCSLVAEPILRRGRLHAVLLLENHFIRGAFTAERSDTVKLIADQLAVSLDNAQVYADFRRVADEQTALRRVATIVAQGEPPSTVLAAVAQEAGQLLSADLVVIGRYGDGPTVTAIVGWRSNGRAVPLGTDVRLGGQNVMSMVFSSGGPVRIEAYSQTSGELARWSQAAGIGSAVGVPITSEGRLWGVIMIGLEHERPWPPDTESRLATFTDLAATAIGNVAAREQLREVADEQAALRRVATLVARGAAPDDRVRRGRRGGRTCPPGRRPRRHRPLHQPSVRRVRRRLEPGRRGGLGRQDHSPRRPQRLDRGLRDQAARACRPSWRRGQPDHRHRSKERRPFVGRRADQRGGAALGSHDRRLGPRGGTPGRDRARARRLHRAARHRDRQHPGPRGAASVPSPDRGCCGSGASADRAGRARRRPTAAGLAGPAAADRAGVGAARARRAPRGARPRRRCHQRGYGGAAGDRAGHPPGRARPGWPPSCPQDARPPRRDSRPPRPRRGRTAARSRRDQCLLCGRRNADQRSEARKRLGRHGRGRMCRRHSAHLSAGRRHRRRGLHPG